MRFFQIPTKNKSMTNSVLRGLTLILAQEPEEQVLVALILAIFLVIYSEAASEVVLAEVREETVQNAVRM